MRIRGVVVDEHAHRIANTLVTVSRGDGGLCAATETDEHGCFGFELAPDDESLTTIRAHARGCASEAIHQRDDMPGGETLTIEIVPTATLHGHVHDENGFPVHGALVSTWGAKRTTTDASGGYRLEGLRSGTHGIHVWRNGLQIQTASVVVGAQGAQLDWTLPTASGRWIRFTLTEDTAADVQAHWALWCPHPVHLSLEGTFPDSREVTLGGLPTEHNLQGAAWSTSLQADPTNHYLKADPRHGLIEWCTHLAPAQQETVSGRLVDEHEQPLPTTTVLVCGAGVVDDNPCTSDANGHFTCKFGRMPNDSLDDDLVFSLVEPDRVLDDRDSRAWTNQRCRGRAYRSLPIEGELVLRAVPSAAVQGRVLRDGTAIPGAVVTLLLRWALNDKPHTSQIESTETDDDGHFQFGGLHAAIGNGLFVRIQAPDVDCVSKTFELEQGSTLTLPDQHARALATIRGRLVDATDAPRPAAFVSLDEPDGLLDGWGRAGCETNPEGRFEIHGVRPGFYNVTLTPHHESLEAAPALIAANVEVQSGETRNLGDLQA